MPISARRWIPPRQRRQKDPLARPERRARCGVTACRSTWWPAYLRRDSGWEMRLFVNPWAFSGYGWCRSRRPCQLDRPSECAPLTSRFVWRSTAPGRPSAFRRQRSTAPSTAFPGAASWVTLRQNTLFWEPWRDQHRVAEARDLLGSVYGRFTEGFVAVDLRQAETLLQRLA